MKVQYQASKINHNVSQKKVLQFDKLNLKQNLNSKMKMDFKYQLLNSNNILGSKSIIPSKVTLKF